MEEAVATWQALKKRRDLIQRHLEAASTPPKKRATATGKPANKKAPKAGKGKGAKQEGPATLPTGDTTDYDFHA